LIFIEFCSLVEGVLSKSMMKFESGYNVETVFDGSKLGIEPYAVEVLHNGELLILDSANSNLYRISSSLSLCKSSNVIHIFIIIGLIHCSFCFLGSFLENKVKNYHYVLEIGYLMDYVVENCWLVFFFFPNLEC
jgi:vacuolar-type H+-ATPase subunit I/STV1